MTDKDRDHLTEAMFKHIDEIEQENDQLQDLVNKLRAETKKLREQLEFLLELHEVR